MSSLPTAIAQHTWVKHTITPVEVLDAGDGDPVIFVDPDEQQTAEVSTTVYGCVSCSEPLATHFNTPCQGPTEEN